MDHGDAGELGEKPTVAELERDPALWPVQHRLPVKADHVDPFPGDGVVGQKSLNRSGVSAGYGLFRPEQSLAPLPSSRGRRRDRLVYQRAGLLRIGIGRAGPPSENAFAVGFDQGGVDAVHRGAAHQSQCGDPLRHRRHAIMSFRMHSLCKPDTSPLTGRRDGGTWFYKLGIRPPMSAYKSELLIDLSRRGYINQCTDEESLDALAAQGPLAGYIGFDCTAPSLHAGSLLAIMLLRKLQQTGHKPIVLMGGGTTKIGDPSGKDEARRLLTREQIAANMEGIKSVFSKFLNFGDGPSDAVMVDNADWLDTLDYIGFLRDYGRHFTVNRMLTFDSVRLRLEREQPLTFLEFNYMVLQAYDFLELYRRYGCRLQMGGSDQWGNIVNGVELTRRVEGAEVFGLTTSLLTTASGAKMGKTAEGAVWLDAEMLSPYEYWQYWRNTEDADVGRFLRLFTELPLDEIARLERLEGAEVNEAKKVLANEATRLAHGAAAAERAAETAAQTFERGAYAEGLPTVEIPRGELEAGLGLLSALVRAGLAESNGAARRHVKGGGARVNDTPAEDDRSVLTTADVTAEGAIKLSVGKKRHVLLRPV
jgi:tyrosyl-tRNA synthetase